MTSWRLTQIRGHPVCFQLLSGKPRFAVALLAATMRGKFVIATYLFDPDTFETKLYGFIATGAQFGEPYGFCMGRIGNTFLLIPNNKNGDPRL